jgi:hypothetical protein
MRFGAMRSAAQPKSALLAASRPDEALDRPPGPREQAGRPVDRAVFQAGHALEPYSV